jgi:hypothetical protein
MPTANVKNSLTVATKAFFIGGGELEKVMANSYKNASFIVGAARVTAVTPRGDFSAQTGRRSRDSGPTISSHTPPSALTL